MHLLNELAQALLLLALNPMSLIPSSVMIPVPNPYQRIKKSIEPEPIYVPQQDIQGVETGGDQDVDEGLVELSDLEPAAISADASETLRKINPLTIADQVSNLLRKDNEEPTSSVQAAPVIKQDQYGPNNMQRIVLVPSGDAKETPVRNSVLDDEAFLRAIQKKNPISSPQRSAPQEGQEVESLYSAKGSDVNPGKPAESPEGYIRQEAPKIVNKPIPKNNAGYSVIVMAGDGVKFPLKVDSKPVKTQRKHGSEVKEDCCSALGQLGSRAEAPEVVQRGEAEKKNLRGKNSKKEFRVSKQYGRYPDFPVYDEDFNFVPDPLQGVLDENYWKDDTDKNVVQKLAVPMESYKIGEFGFEPHNILMRSNDDNGESVKVNERIQACGGGGAWRKKSNNTEIVTD